MTMTTTESIITIAVVVLETMLTRFLPFLVFPEGAKPPKYVTYLGTVLPSAVVGLLVVYCMKDAVFTSWHGLPEIIAGAVVVLIHKWRHNMLLSMACGTILYMVLVQTVFG